MIKLFKKLNSKKGFSMTELLTVIVILSLLTVAVAVMVSTSATTYKNSLMISESATVENMINTALSEELRYADFVKTDGEENVQGINRVEVNKIAYSISLDGNGRLIKKNNNSNTTVALLNRGSYANLHVEDFSISYNNSVFTCTYKLADKNSSYVSDPIVYTVKSAVFQPERDAESGVVLPSPNITPPPAPGTEDFHKIHIVFMVSDSDGVRTVGDILENVANGSEYYVTFDQNSEQFNNAYVIAGYNNYSPDEINIPSVKYDRTIVINCNPVVYTVDYDFGDNPEGVSPGINYTEFTVETPSVMLNPPTKLAVSFTGWTCPELGITEPQKELLLDTSILKSRTYYAHWGDAHFKIHFDGNGATSGTMADQVFTYGTPQTLTPNVFQKTNYSFAGWSDTKGGPVQYTDGQEGSTIVNADGATKTLYAVWPYTVHFKSNASDATGEYSQDMRVNDHTTKLISVDGRITRPGYSFVEWTTKSDGSGDRYGNNTQVLAESVSGVVNGETNLYAQWSANSYNITYIADTDCNFGRSSFFSDYKTSISGTIVFDRPYSSASCGMPTDQIENITPGHEFIGWYTGRNGTGTKVVASDLYKFPNDTTLYAYCKLKSFTVTFNNNGHGTAPATQTVNYDGRATNPGTLTATGYTHNGRWYTNSGCTSEFIFNTRIRENRTLYAKWTANTYKVHFNGNESTGGSMSEESFTYDQAKNLTSNGFSRAGYTFNGWAESAGGPVVYTNGQSVLNLSSVNNATVNLYAKWTANTDTPYTVQWFYKSGNSYSSSPSRTETRYGTTDTIASVTGADKTLAHYSYDTSAANVESGNIAGSGSLVLKVYLKPDKCTVTFNLMGHGTNFTQSIDYGGKASETKPSASGFRFDGWYSDQACTNKFKFETAITGDTTLYAKWSEQYTFRNDVIGITIISVANNNDGTSQNYTLGYRGTATMYKGDTLTVTILSGNYYLRNDSGGIEKRISRGDNSIVVSCNLHITSS